MGHDSTNFLSTEFTESIPADETIRSQLTRILASPEFKGKHNLSSFLQFVVENTLAGNAHEIKGFTIATQVLGRRDNFDAVRDPTVRVLAGKLRAALEHYYLTSGRHDPVRIEMPRGTYVPIFSLQPVRHAREMPPSRVQPEADGVLSQRGPGIAVMPFVNLSGDPEQEHFVDGLTEELTAEITRYRDLRIVACHSTMKLKGIRRGARELGLELNVRFLVEGSVRREGDCVKIAVRLIDTSTQMQIWGEQYRRDLTAGSVIEIQEEIAARVAGRICGHVGIIPRSLLKESRGRAPETLEIYDAFLRLHHYSLVLTPETFAEALEAMTHAHHRYPESGIVCSMLANLYADNNTLWLKVPDISMEDALSYAKRGALLEPQDQYVRTMLAHLHFLVNHREDFFREAERAIGLNPNSPMYTAFMGWDMALFGEWDRGLRLLEEAIAWNPYYPSWLHVAFYMYHYNEGRYGEAWRETEEIHLPHLFWDPLLRAAALGQMGRLEEAAAAAENLLRLRPDFPHLTPRLLAFYIKPDTLIDRVVEGLRKAGLEITDGTRL